MRLEKTSVALNPQSESVRTFAYFSDQLCESLTPDGRVKEVHPDELPEPFGQLLVHTRHMTPTLSAFYREPIRLRVLDRRQNRRIFTRRVALFTGMPPQPERIVEYAMIQVDLSMLAENVVEAIIAGEQPLGRLLHQHGVSTSVHPEKFVRLDHADPCIPHWYGRIGSITCAGKPAIQMYELLTGADSSSS